MNLQHISDKPWSDYTAADYTLEQWHASCLIHQHTGPPTSKSQCKLPVKTPGGAINRNGVHAAAAALAGARGGVNASAEEKASAARALRRLYSQLNEDPPPSLAQHSGVGHMSVVIDEEVYLEHFGVKGMRWGQRKAARQLNRERNKASKARDKEAFKQAVAARDKAIDRARGKVASGKTQAEFKKAKADFAKNKEELGSREARKLLNKARNKRFDEKTMARQAKSGRETAVALLATAGVLGVSIFLNQAARKM